MKLNKTYEIASFKALDDEGPGKFEAVVSVFGNVDLQGDRTMPGAFKRTIKELREKGDLLPVIWSHDWLNPMAHIGYADPNDVSEIPLKGKDGVVGGLLVRGTMDVHKPFAAQVFDLLKARRVKEWSFSYDVAKERVNEKDGANELLDLDLFEVGPTLKGANPQTYTVGAKAVLEEELKDAYEGDKAWSRFINMVKGVEDPLVARALTHTFTKGTGDATRRFHVETAAGRFACVANASGKVVDTHDSEDDANTHVSRMEVGDVESYVDDDVRKALGLAPIVRMDTTSTSVSGMSNVTVQVTPVIVPENVGLLNALNAWGKAYDVEVTLESVGDGVAVADVDGVEFEFGFEEKDGLVELDDAAFLFGEKVGSKPWHVEKRGDQWCVIKDTDGTTVACHDTEEEANAQVRALYANESSADADAGKSDSYYVEPPEGEAALRAHLTADPPEGHGHVPGELSDDMDEQRLTAAHHNQHSTRGTTGHFHQDVADVAKSDGDVEKAADAFIKAVGEKVGRVISAKSAAGLKSALTGAVDDFVAEVNGAAAADEEKIDPDADIKARLAEMMEGIDG